MNQLVETNPFIRIDKEGAQTEDLDKMLREKTIEVIVNGRFAGSIPHTPQYTTELITGWLNDAGYISKRDEIGSIQLSEDGVTAIVTLSGKSKRQETDNVIPIQWKKEWIFALAKDFEIQMPLRRITMAAHNCRLAVGKGNDMEILFRCEDIGRHSAIDKAIGWAMINDVDLTGCILFSSGRISRAMVHKVIQAGIPVMAGKGTISGEAVDLAKRKHLTLLGYCKEDSICIFNDEA